MTADVSSTQAGSVFVLEMAAWTRDPSDPTKWWRDGAYATARAGVINIKGVISSAEAHAFGVLADAHLEGRGGVAEAGDAARSIVADTSKPARVSKG